MKTYYAASILFAAGFIGLIVLTLGIGVALSWGYTDLPWLRLLGGYIILFNATLGGAAVARAFDPTRKP